LPIMIDIVKVLEDNFSYIIIDEGSRLAAVVDPVDPVKVGYLCF
jgi:hypothetical protein